MWFCMAIKSFLLFCFSSYGTFVSVFHCFSLIAILSLLLKSFFIYFLNLFLLQIIIPRRILIFLNLSVTSFLHFSKDILLIFSQKTLCGLYRIKCCELHKITKLIIVFAETEFGRRGIFARNAGLWTGSCPL